MQQVKTNNYPNQQYLKECFTYSPKTGELFWNTRPPHHFNTVGGQKRFNKQFANKKISHKNDQGYICVRLNDHLLRAHRIIWIMEYGYNPGNKDIDHKNRIRDDNRIKNLREKNRRGNNINGNVKKNNISGITGVGWDTKHKLWDVRIRDDNGRRIRFGYFKDLTKAALQRYNAEKKYRYITHNDKPSSLLYLEKMGYLTKEKEFSHKELSRTLFIYDNINRHLIWSAAKGSLFNSKSEYLNWYKEYNRQWVQPSGYDNKRGYYIDCFNYRFFLAEVIWYYHYGYVTEADLAYKDNNPKNLHHNNLVEKPFENNPQWNNKLGINGVMKKDGTYKVKLSGQHKLNKTRDNIIDACLCRYHYEKKFRTLEDYPTNSFAYRYLKEHGIKTNQDIYISFDYINEYFKLKGKKILFNKRPPYHFLSKEDWRNWNKIYSDQEVPVTEDGYLDVGEGTWSKDMITYILNYHFIPEIKDENPLDGMLNKSKK